MNFQKRKFAELEESEDSELENSDDESAKPFLSKETEKLLVQAFQDKPIKKLKEYNKIFPRPTKVFII